MTTLTTLPPQMFVGSLPVPEKLRQIRNPVMALNALNKPMPESGLWTSTVDPNGRCGWVEYNIQSGFGEEQKEAWLLKTLKPLIHKGFKVIIGVSTT